MGQDTSIVSPHTNRMPRAVADWRNWQLKIRFFFFAWNVIDRRFAKGSLFGSLKFSTIVNSIVPRWK